MIPRIEIQDSAGDHFVLDSNPTVGLTTTDSFPDEDVVAALQPSHGPPVWIEAEDLKRIVLWAAGVLAARGES